MRPPWSHPYLFICSSPSSHPTCVPGGTTHATALSAAFMEVAVVTHAASARDIDRIRRRWRNWPGFGGC